MGPATSSINISWELARNANSHSTTQLNSGWWGRGGAQQSMFWPTPFPWSLKFGDHWSHTWECDLEVCDSGNYCQAFQVKETRIVCGRGPFQVSNKHLRQPRTPRTGLSKSYFRALNARPCVHLCEIQWSYSQDVRQYVVFSIQYPIDLKAFFFFQLALPEWSPRTQVKNISTLSRRCALIRMSVVLLWNGPGWVGQKVCWEP